MTNKESQNEFFNFDAPIIKEWEKEQALEQEPSGDLISRVDALASIKNLYPDMPIVDILGARRKWLEKYAPYFECENAIERLPSVKPQEPTSEQVEEYCRKRCLTLVSNEFMAHIIADSGESIRTIPSAEKTGHCEDCKHFRKIPYHADTLGKCVHHTGFCPKGDWYCADFEPQESEG